MIRLRHVVCQTALTLLTLAGDLILYSNARYQNFSYTPQFTLRGTPHSHNKLSLYFLVTSLFAIHRQTHGWRQLKKKRFHFYFFSWRV